MWPHRASLSRVGILVMSSERQRPEGPKRSRGALDGEGWGHEPLPTGRRRSRLIDKEASDQATFGAGCQ